MGDATMCSSVLQRIQVRDYGPVVGRVRALTWICLHQCLLVVPCDKGRRLPTKNRLELFIKNSC